LKFLATPLKNGEEKAVQPAGARFIKTYVNASSRDDNGWWCRQHCTASVSRHYRVLLRSAQWWINAV